MLVGSLGLLFPVPSPTRLCGLPGSWQGYVLAAFSRPFPVLGNSSAGLELILAVLV